jgi:hypothetical protein
MAGDIRARVEVDHLPDVKIIQRMAMRCNGRGTVPALTLPQQRSSIPGSSAKRKPISLNNPKRYRDLFTKGLACFNPGPLIKKISVTTPPKRLESGNTVRKRPVMLNRAAPPWWQKWISGQ